MVFSSCAVAAGLMWQRIGYARLCCRDGSAKAAVVMLHLLLLSVCVDIETNRRQ